MVRAIRTTMRSAGNRYSAFSPSRISSPSEISSPKDSPTVASTPEVLAGEKSLCARGGDSEFGRAAMTPRLNAWGSDSPRPNEDHVLNPQLHIIICSGGWKTRRGHRRHVRLLASPSQRTHHAYP